MTQKRDLLILISFSIFHLDCDGSGFIFMHDRLARRCALLLHIFALVFLLLLRIHLWWLHND